MDLGGTKYHEAVSKYVKNFQGNCKLLLTPVGCYCLPNLENVFCPRTEKQVLNMDTRTLIFIAKLIPLNNNGCDISTNHDHISKNIRPMEVFDPSIDTSYGTLTRIFHITFRYTDNIGRFRLEKMG